MHLRIISRFLFSLIIGLSGIPVDLVAQRAELFVAPPVARGILDGNSSFSPFETTGRFQQIYDSSVFADLPPGGGFIVALTFREDAFLGHGFLATVSNIQINISTTSKSPDGLSAVFAENIGIDDQVVLGPRSVLLAGGGGGGVTGFGTGFVFTDQPFYYDPANGNLLVDFRIYQGFGPVFPPQTVAVLDAFDTIGDSISSVFASGGTIPLIGQADSLGLATALSIIPVPEPSTLALLAIGAGVLMLEWKRRRKG